MVLKPECGSVGKMQSGVSLVGEFKGVKSVCESDDWKSLTKREWEEEDEEDEESVRVSSNSAAS